MIDSRRPLIGLTAEEPVEFIKTCEVWPASERPRGTDFPDGRFMMLAIGGRAVTVQSQCLGDGRDVVGQHAGRTGKGRCDFRDLSLVARVVIATGDQSLPSRRAKCRGVELVVQQPSASQLVKVRCWQDTSRRTGAAEAEIIKQDDDHVWCILRRFDFEHWRCLGVAGVQCGDRRIPWPLDRKFRAVNLGTFLSKRVGRDTRYGQQCQRYRQTKLSSHFSSCCKLKNW